MTPAEREPVPGTPAARHPRDDRPPGPGAADHPSPDTANAPEVTIDLPTPEAAGRGADAPRPADPAAHPDFADTKSFAVGDTRVPAGPDLAENAETGSFVAGDHPAVPAPVEDGVTRTFDPAGGPAGASLVGDGATRTFTPGGTRSPEGSLDSIAAGATRSYSYGLDGPKPTKRAGGLVLRDSAPPGYEILGELGRGGMGVVYKARQIKLNRIAALKMILAGVHAAPEQLARFQTEAEASARLTHPGIVQVYESGEHDGLPYFALEFVDGGPLNKTTKKEPQPPDVAAAIVQALGRAIQYAHDHKVVHRDLKPANVLVGTDGSLKIADFGLAKKLEEEDGQTLSGSIVGTPQYMAPEQARGDTRHAGPAADQYSLGAILYELLVGRPPFVGASVLETLDLVQKKEPVPVRDLQPKVPIDLETICLKALQKDPAKRYPSAGAMADDLGRFLNREPILARPVGAAERLWRWCRRNPRVAGLAAGVAGLLVTIAAGSLAFAFEIKKLAAAETRAKELAVENEKLAQKNEQKAVENADRAETNRKQAEANEVTAKEQRARAVGQRNLAVDTLLGLATTVQSKLKRQGLQELQQELFQLADDTLREVRKDGFEPKVARALASLYQRRGDFFIQEHIPPRPAEAAKMYAQAHAVAADLEKADPTNLVYQLNMGVVTARLGDASRRAGDIPAARRWLEDSLARRERLARMPRQEVVAGLVAAGRTRDDAEDRAGGLSDLAAGNHTLLGNFYLEVGDPATARDHFRAVLRGLEAKSPGGPAAGDSEAAANWAGVYDQLGEVAFHLGDPAAARAYVRKSLGLSRPLADKAKASLDERRGVTIGYDRLGDLALLVDRDPAAARARFDDALAARRAILADNPKSAGAVQDVADSCYKAAVARDRAGDGPGAAELFAECREKRRTLLADGGLQADPEPTARLALALARCGDHAEAARLAAEVAAGRAGHPGLLYSAGCGFALCRRAAADPADKDRYGAAAVAALARAVDIGWMDRVMLELDPDLDAVRDLPGFRAVLDRVPPPPPPAKPTLFGVVLP